MFVKTHLLSFTAFLTFVTAVKCGTSRDHVSRTSSTTKLPRGLKKSGTRVDNENIHLGPRRKYESINEFRKNFEHVKKQNVAHYANNHGDLYDTFLPYNFFKCPPCICKNISSNLVSAICNNCQFRFIPQKWSFELSELILTDCERLKVLDLGNLSKYPSLTRVLVTFNSVVKILSSSDLNVSSKIIELDLTSNSIKTVENNSFLFFNNSQVLSLSSNRITALTRQMFAGLNSLRFLSVSHNDINFIANDTFDDLGNLVFLDMHGNKIIPLGHDLRPVRFFMALSNLEQLYIHDVCVETSHHCSTYTNKALQDLTNLKLLQIDGDDRRGLGPEVKNLEHLRTLKIITEDGYILTNESYFDNVLFINTLVLSGNFPHNIHPKAFTKLRNLVNFTYSLNSYFTNICDILSDIQYLLNSSLKFLTLTKLNDPNCGCKVLTNEDAKYLTLLRLYELNLSHNSLFYLRSGFIAMLPATLKKIDLSGNSLSGYLFSNFDLFPQGIVELNLNDQNYDYKECYDVENASLQNVCGYNLNQSTCLISSEAETKKSFKHKELEFNKTENNIKMTEVFAYYLPSNLRIFRGNNFRYIEIYFPIFNRLTKNSLRELSLAGGDITNWALYKISSKIEIADFSNNFAEYFLPYFFPVNSSLNYLAMSNNLFGNAFQHDPDRLFFTNTKQLIALDFSQNFITEIPSDYFRNLFKLKMLDMSRNKLQKVNISFSHMIELRFLNFSSNSITTISKLSRDDLDLIAADHQVYLDLTSNPLPCTCEGLELMKWMAFTKVYLLNQDFLVCRNDLQEVLEIGNIFQRVQILQRQCSSKTVIIIICVFSFIVFGIMLLTSLMYRFRWKLRYLRSLALVKLLGFRPDDTNNVRYRFDAYILYTDDTRRFVLRDCVRELEEKRGHRLCIEDRDFLPGTYNVSNIVSGVQNSAKTVAMVTPEFYQGEYSEYSVKMALMEEIFMRRSVLFLCVCEPTDDEDLSHDLLTAMKQNNYIEYPPRDDVTDEIIEEFWDQFSRAIGRNNNEEI